MPSLERGGGGGGEGSYTRSDVHAAPLASKDKLVTGIEIRLEVRRRARKGEPNLENASRRHATGGL